jgi:hypothetical protein
MIESIVAIVGAPILVDSGWQCVCVVDSAGALVLDEVSDRVAVLVAELGDDAQVRFHGHENLYLAAENSICAIRAGAKKIDRSARRFGAGAGNTPVEAFVAACGKVGICTDRDFFEVVDAAEDVARPGDDEGLPTRSRGTNDPICGGVFQLPTACRTSGRAVCSLIGGATHEGRPAQTGRVTRGSVDRHRTGVST